VHSADLQAAATTHDARLESPRDVEFALNALLGCASRDADACARARADILGRLRPAPTIAELVDAVFAWRREQKRRAEEVEKVEEAARRRHALRLLRAYFLLDPPVPGEAGALTS
jgi:hypothetical protein